jgi:hypothetical protein
MEQTGTIPRGAVDASDLASLFSNPRDVVTVALATPAATENAAYKNEVHWNDISRELERQGAGEETLDAIGQIISDAHQFGEGLLAVADESGLRFVQHSPIPPRREVARRDCLPSISTVIDWRQHQPRYLVVLVDHQGADLLLSGGDGPDVDAEVKGSGRYPLSKNAPGGWSQRRYQQHAVENWAKNARQVAEAVTRLADEVDPEILLAGGDPRSLELLIQALPDSMAERTERVEGTRAADGGGEATAREVARLVETVSARMTVDLLEEFRQHLGRSDRAVEGIGPTLDALSEARVAVLLVADDPADERRAWFGEELEVAGADRRAVEGIGSGHPREGRLIDVAIRAAVGTGAGIRVVPSNAGPAGNLGGLLRWSD